MVEITNLPVDILTLIMVIVATSTNNGARDIAWIFATCKEFKKLAKQASVLKILKFPGSNCTLDYRFTDIKLYADARNLQISKTSFLRVSFVGARYRNQVAESSFGKGLLDGDTYCWTLIFLNINPACP
ncbi:pentatricopeptide repeat protein [Artemisia annua]|uniref:Pentatricopeptide repeat protein n=1 Tax=Artemisia annua TaxID=35608 RepID=A0A2U1PFY6_ARTAN|nr:pentatricopeptide repeat protein [Artemisia annua]